MADIPQPDRTVQIIDNQVALLTLCAALLACLDEHARREESPLGTYLPHLRQMSDELMALVQLFVGNEPTQQKQ